jgi:hypothetical protein
MALISFEEARRIALIPEAIPALQQIPPYSNFGWTYLFLNSVGAPTFLPCFVAQSLLTVLLGFPL